MTASRLQPQLHLQYRLALACCALAWLVMMLGAYVRLSDAGLGCPDWPGCYGHLTVPTPEGAQAMVGDAYAQRPLQTDKAWKEMIHRYLAGTLGLGIAVLALLAWRHRHRPEQPRLLPALLLGTVLFQALLGMWTVTLLVKPLVVTAHLFGGLATLALAWLLLLRLHRQLYPAPPVPNGPPQTAQAWVLVGLALLLGQIFLGGWTSTNYAALGCTEFPACYNGQWWPAMDFGEAFVLWRGLGVDYEFGVLEFEARTAIHVSHRLGALVTAVYLSMLGWRLLRSEQLRPLRVAAMTVLFLLLLQVGLGIINVVAQLPLPVAVAHNGVAALLLLGLLTLWERLHRNGL